MLIRNYFCALALSFISIWGYSSDFEPRKGDLLFQGEGRSEFSSAIAAATVYGDSMTFVHVAIADGNGFVIEASPKNGVCLTPLDDFLAESPRIDGKPAVVVKRIKWEFPVNKAIDAAMSHLGEPYDWTYLPDNGKMYCSELVYEAFSLDDGSHLFRQKPMNFRDKDGVMPPFWTELYQSYGMEVPEGMDGTNPNDLSRDVSLEEVFRYF